MALFPFKQGMSLLVVMPSSGQVNMSAISAKLNTTDLYARLDRPRTMQVKLPKFKLEYGQELQEALTSMGKGGNVDKRMAHLHRGALALMELNSVQYLGTSIKFLPEADLMG